MIINKNKFMVSNVFKVRQAKKSFVPRYFSQIVKNNSSKKRLPTFPLNKIGPHNLNVLSVIFCTLLGDAHAQKRRNTTRIHFRQCSEHNEHLFKLWEFFSEKGYTSPFKPVVKSYIHKKTKKVIYHYAYETYSYASLNWVYDLFYKDKIKSVPKCISDFLSPKGLAIWIMDDGNNESLGGVRLNTQSFTYEDISFLCKVLFNKYNLVCSINKAKISKKTNKQMYVLYIKKESKPLLQKLVLPFLVPSMYYKVGL